MTIPQWSFVDDIIEGTLMTNEIEIEMEQYIIFYGKEITSETFKFVFQGEECFPRKSYLKWSVFGFLVVIYIVFAMTNTSKLSLWNLVIFI